MEEATWLPVDGTRSVELYAYITKPSVLTCNSYVLGTADRLVVIDPGGDAGQTRTLTTAVNQALRRKPRPVLICLTHCHADHMVEALSGPAWREFPGLEIMAAESGIAALKAGDRRTTQAEILDREITTEGVNLSVYPPALDLGDGDVLEIIPAPGHSADGVCLRVGTTLFIGDLLSATAPLIAGAPGWSRSDLVTSLDRINRLVPELGIALCCPGHGRVLAGDVINKTFARVIAEAAQLEGIVVADRSRVVHISNEARKMFDELNDIFRVLTSRIERTAGQLHYLEEFAAAREIRGVIDSEQVHALLLEFRTFQAALPAGQAIEVQVALKAIQVAGRISKLLEYDKLAAIIEPSLLRLARTTLSDFAFAAKGITLADEIGSLELNTFLRSLAAELKQRADQHAIEDIPDDPAAFTRYLVTVISHVPALAKTSVAVKEFRTPAGAPAAPQRFHDALRRLLEDLADSGAARILLSVAEAAPRARLTVTATFAGASGQAGARLLQQHQRRLRPAGAELSVHESPQTIEFTLRFHGTLS